MPYSIDLALGLPSYARLDLAYELESVLTYGGVSAPFTYNITGQYLEIVLSAHVQITTSADVQTRAISFAANDANARAIWVIPATTGQTAGKVWSYTALATVAVAYSDSVAATVLPLPELPLSAGYSFVMPAGNFNANDTFGPMTLNTLRIPTGPALATPNSTPTVATPVLA